MDIVTDVKILLAKKRMTMSQLAAELGVRLKKHYALSNLSQKLYNNTLKYSEMKIIADILGYEIEFKEKR